MEYRYIRQLNIDSTNISAKISNISIKCYRNKIIDILKEKYRHFLYFDIDIVFKFDS